MSIKQVKIKRHSRRRVVKNEKENAEQNDQQTNSVIDMIDGLIVNHKQQIKQLRLIKKRYYKDIHNSANKKRKKEKKTGFAKETIVPDKITAFLNIDKGTEMSRPCVTKLIYSELKNRKLFYEKDKRVLRVDDDVCDMLNLSNEVNNSTNPKDENGFNLYNFQKIIANCYKNN